MKKILGIFLASMMLSGAAYAEHHEKKAEPAGGKEDTRTGVGKEQATQPRAEKNVDLSKEHDTDHHDHAGHTHDTTHDHGDHKHVVDEE